MRANSYQLPPLQPGRQMAKRKERPRRHAAASPSVPPKHFFRRHGVFGVVFSILLTVLLLEAGTRLLRPPLSYEEWRRASLRYVYNPNWHWSLRPGEYIAPQGTVVINAQGLRGPSIAAKKPEGVTRIVCLGGSSTFNYGARQGRTWPARLSERLSRQLGRPVEVINGGTPGYSSYQSSKRFEHQFSEWEPDLVVIYHMWNDLKNFWMTDAEELIQKWDIHGRFNEASTLLDPLPFLDRLCSVSQFATHMRFAWIRYLMKKRSVNDEGWTHPELDKQIAPAGVEFYRSNLERVARICEDRSIPFLIVDQPMLLTATSTRQEMSKVAFQATGFRPGILLQAIGLSYDVNADVAERYTFTSRVPTAGFPHNLQHFSDHVHLRERGLAAVAQFLTPPCLAALHRSP